MTFGLLLGTDLSGRIAFRCGVGLSTPEPAKLGDRQGLFFFGLFSVPLTIWAQTLRMQLIPVHLRGRTFALLRMLMQSGHPIGGALAGGLFPLVGMMAVSALTALMVGAPGGVGYLVRELRLAGSRLTMKYCHER